MYLTRGEVKVTFWLLGQAGPGAAKRGFGYESVNRLKTTCGRPGTRVGYPENPVPFASEMLSETIHEFECRRAIQGCFWGFSDRSQAQKHALRCLRAFRVCRRSLGMIFRQVWKRMIFEIFRGFHYFLDFSDPDPIRRSDFPSEKSCFAGFGASNGPQSI